MLRIISLLFIFILSTIHAQSLSISKIDGTKLDYTISTIDSLTFSTSPLGNLVNSVNWVATDENLQGSLDQNNSIAISTESDFTKIDIQQNLGVNIFYLIPTLVALNNVRTLNFKWKQTSGLITTLNSIDLFDINLELVDRIEIPSKQIEANTSLYDYHFETIYINGDQTIFSSAINDYGANGGQIIYSKTISSSKYIAYFALRINSTSNSELVISELYLAN